jgi:hypothetical protein
VLRPAGRAVHQRRHFVVPDCEDVVTATNGPVLVGVFDDRMAAENSIGELEAAGFKPDQIGFAIRGCDPVPTEGVFSDP